MISDRLQATPEQQDHGQTRSVATNPHMTSLHNIGFSGLKDY